MPRKKVAAKRGRRPKSATIEKAVPVEVYTEPSPISPATRYVSVSEIEELDSEVTVSTTPEAISLFSESPDLPVRDPLRPDQDLAEAEKAEFKRLLDAEMPLNERARQLVKLARFSDTKRAPVALRAIQVINDITGVMEDAANEAPSMFNLPSGVKVAINVEVPDK